MLFLKRLFNQPLNMKINQKSMKKFKYTLAGFLLLGIVFSVSAQTQKGKFLLGGGSSLNLSSANSKLTDLSDEEQNLKTYEIKFSPQTGYFFVDNWAVGMKIPFDYSLIKVDNNSKDKSTSLIIAPFVIHYFGNGKLKPYLKAGVGWGTEKMVYILDDLSIDPDYYSKEEYKFSQFLVDAEAGISVFLNEKAAIDLGISYTSLTLKQQQGKSLNNFNDKNGFDFNIGFSIIL